MSAAAQSDADAATLWRTVIVGSLYLAALLLTLIAIAAPTMLPLFFGSSP